MQRTGRLTALILLILGLTISFARAEANDKVIVYYFYTSYRCPTCKKIEEYTKGAVESSFANEIKAGKVEFMAINTDEKGNGHYLKDYQLYSKSVVISLMKGGKEQKYKNLPKIWQHIGNQGKFYEYIQAETDEYLAEVKE